MRLLSIAAATLCLATRPATVDASCDFCNDDRVYMNTLNSFIQFSSGNDSVSCLGLLELVQAGIGDDFCAAEKEAIEAACCIGEPTTGTDTGSGNDNGNLSLGGNDSNNNSNSDSDTYLSLGGYDNAQDGGTVVVPISFYGLNYNTRKGPDWAADRERCKSRAEIVRDLQMLSKVTTRIRLLSMVDCHQGELVWQILNDELKDTDMEVWLGLWVGPDPQVFIDEYEALSALVPTILASPNYKSKLSGVSVGSEAIYREDVTVAEAIANLDATRVLLQASGMGDVTVAVVDIAPVYSNNQDLRIASDTIMTNTFPFWEGLPIEAAIDELETDLGWLVNLPESQGKPFILSEHGWPSGGYLDDVGVASPENQRQYLKDSFCYLKEKGWAYYWFTAIDNDWRQLQDPNNSIEGNWGFLTANLQLKQHFEGFAFDCPNDNSNVQYSFAGIDWSVPALGEEDPVDPATASCGLWRGCEALAGPCCPTLGGDFLGCCREENFLGELAAAPSASPTAAATQVQDLTGDTTADVNNVEVPSTPSCEFCADGQKYNNDPTTIINFSSGNDSVSCLGLSELISSGLGVDFCEQERSFVEAACCIQTMAPTRTPPTQYPTRGIRNPRTLPPTRAPTVSPTLRPTMPPTPRPTAFPTKTPTPGPTTPPTLRPTGTPTKPPTVGPTVPAPTASPTVPAPTAAVAMTTDPTAAPQVAEDTTADEVEATSVFPDENGVFPWEEDGGDFFSETGTGAAKNSSGNSNTNIGMWNLMTMTVLMTGMIGSAVLGRA